MNIGYFEHWRRPVYAFVDFLRENGIDIHVIDYTQANYLEDFDIVIIEQNGFNDFIENDEGYFQDWVYRGGICLFMHQDYIRWAPYFIPYELGFTQLIHRYVPTVYDYECYMLPTVEPAGKCLFSMPEKITSDEMVYWRIKVNSYNKKPVKSAALSCFLAPDNWEVLGSYMDPAVKNGALILQAEYGKGLYFLNQILFPEELDENSSRTLDFWKKYLKNLLAHFNRFKNGIECVHPITSSALPLKRNYKAAIHMHSLDWHGCDSSLGTTNAVMRYMDMDICCIAVKDAAPYDGNLNLIKYSDDRVLFIHGQEYHPFNWNSVNQHCGHNTYHMLALGVDGNSYTTEFTRSLFSDAEANTYLGKAITYIHAHGGVACATHPFCNYWHNYDFDAVDMEPLKSASGSHIEKYWLSGKKITIMNSVDFFGVQRMLDNPAVNFIYTGGLPDRDSVVRAIKMGHVIATCDFAEADITLNGKLPGDEISLSEAADCVINIFAQVRTCVIREIRIYADADLIYCTSVNSSTVTSQVRLSSANPNKFIRVEISGDNPGQIAVSTPFYIRSK